MEQRLNNFKIDRALWDTNGTLLAKKIAPVPPELSDGETEIILEGIKQSYGLDFPTRVGVIGQMLVKRELGGSNLNIPKVFQGPPKMATPKALIEEREKRGLEAFFAHGVKNTVNSGEFYSFQTRLNIETMLFTSGVHGFVDPDPKLQILLRPPTIKSSPVAFKLLIHALLQDMGESTLIVEDHLPTARAVSGILGVPGIVVSNRAIAETMALGHKIPRQSSPDREHIIWLEKDCGGNYLTGLHQIQADRYRKSKQEPAPEGTQDSFTAPQG